MQRSLLSHRFILRAGGSTAGAASSSHVGGCFSRAASVWSFGDNSNGALGIPSPLLDAYEPTKITSLPATVSAVASGHYHSLAVDASGEVWAWGRNEEGQLGRGAHATRDTWTKPEMVLGLDNVKAQAAYASGVVSAAIGGDGSLWVWGRSKRGQLGLGKGVTEALKPSKVEALSGHKISWHLWDFVSEIPHTVPSSGSCLTSLRGAHSRVFVAMAQRFGSGVPCYFIYLCRSLTGLFELTLWLRRLR